jgi:hypothetical protein
MNVIWKKLSLIIGMGMLVLIVFQSSASAETVSPTRTVSVDIDLVSAFVVAGDWVEFSTEIRNLGEVDTPKLVAHLNVAAAIRGPYVDPEDWSPVRTQYIDPISQGDSATRFWEVHTLTDGDFAVFVTVVSLDESFVPQVSPTLLISAVPNEFLPLKEVLAVAVVVPLFPLTLLLFSIVRSRSKVPNRN